MNPVRRFLGEARIKGRNYYLGHPFRVFTATVKCFFFGHLLYAHFYSWGVGWGPSMLPTFEVMGDNIIISHRYRRGKGIQVGDLVQFKSVHQVGENVIKRVIGLEGDYVLRDTPGKESDMMIQVPQGHCWLVGDNLPHSRDSRQLGPIPLALIQGKVISKILPFSERKWFENGLQPTIRR